MGKERQSKRHAKGWRGGKKGFSRYFFVFVLSQSSGPDYLGCSSKTAEPLFTAIKFVVRM